MVHLVLRPSAFWLGVFLWLVSGGGTAAETEKAGGQPRLLAVFSNASTLTASIGVAEGLRAALDPLPRHELLTEFRAVQQFPEDAEDSRFVEMLARKYADRRLDAVLAIGPAALRLVLDHRDRFAPGTPIVAAAVTERSLPSTLPEDVHAVRSAFDLEGTVALARRMQPEAERLVVFSGSAAFDEAWERFAREELAGLSGLEVDLVSGLTLRGFKEKAAGLDPDTILLTLTIFEDASGTRFIPAEAGKEIASRSAAPSWAVYRTFLDEGDGGGGVVGGVVETFEAIGRTLGDLTLDVLSGEAEANTIVSMPHVSMIDWDELRRYGLDPGLLPQNAVLIDYDPSFWERHRGIILAVLAVLFAQSATIAALVILGRRWRMAERHMADQRIELARLARVSQLGALSGAITHELNQPLTAILADAEAGAMLIRKSPPDIDGVAEILGDIAEEDRRAARIISSLRALMTGRPVEPAPVDLNEVATFVVDLTHSEAVLRGSRVILSTAPRPLVVLGDKEQFQQVVLNLMLNSMDAMADQPPETRRVTVEVLVLEDGRNAIAVQDTGPGLDRTVAADPFRPFSTTKDNGLGMGLAICRTIAEAHRGTLDFAPVRRGARAVLALPPT